MVTQQPATAPGVDRRLVAQYSVSPRFCQAVAGVVSNSEYDSQPHLHARDCVKTHLLFVSWGTDAEKRRDRARIPYCLLIASTKWDTCSFCSPNPDFAHSLAQAGLQNPAVATLAMSTGGRQGMNTPILRLLGYALALNHGPWSALGIARSQAKKPSQVGATASARP